MPARDNAACSCDNIGVQSLRQQPIPWIWDGVVAENAMTLTRTMGPYHFARQFKAATGLPPHQYVISRRVERAKHLLQAGIDLSLAEVATDAGFSDQSQFSPHFKRLAGRTPRPFRMPAGFA